MVLCLNSIPLSFSSLPSSLSQAPFRASMWQPFLQVLLQVLVQKSHNLLQEEILSCIYTMASVDFAAFHTEFLPAFLGDVDGLWRAEGVTGGTVQDCASKHM